MVSPAQNFRVQIAAFEEAKTNAYFEEKGVPNFFGMTDQTGVYRYFAGSYPNREEADKMQQKMVERGFASACVIDLEEQRILSNTNCPIIRNGIVFVKNDSLADTERNIYFDLGKSSLNAEARVKLDEMVRIMKKNPKYSLNVKGYTDAVGDGKANIELATNRAREARNYLIDKGIRADRMFLKIFGEADPAAPNQNDELADLPENRKYNRRVVLTVTKEKGK